MAEVLEAAEVQFSKAAHRGLLEEHIELKVDGIAIKHNLELAVQVEAAEQRLETMEWVEYQLQMVLEVLAL